MTLNRCEEVIDAYLAELQTDFDCSQSADGWFLTTPFVRPDGEGIEIELQVLPDGNISITDMGDTLGYLYVNGITLSRTLIASVRQMAKPYRVALHRNQLSLQVDQDSVGEGVHDLIQATLRITDLIQKRRPTSRVVFDVEVESLIINSGVTYDVEYEVPGSKENHSVKFHVDSGKNLLIHPISATTAGPARSWAERWAYRFADILAENPAWHPVVVLDDRGARSDAWSPYALTPVKEYAVLWSNRIDLESILKAGDATPTFTQ